MGIKYSNGLMLTSCKQNMVGGPLIFKMDCTCHLSQPRFHRNRKELANWYPLSTNQQFSLRIEGTDKGIHAGQGVLGPAASFVIDPS